MPFSKDNPPPSRKGKKNKMTGAQGDLLSAWDKVAGPETAKRLMKSAIEDAEGRKANVIDRTGKAVEIVVKDWEPLKTILPYIAKRLTDSVGLELDGKELTIRVVNYGQAEKE